MALALDIFCVLILAFHAFTGYRGGIVKQVLLIACLVGSFFLCQPLIGYSHAFLVASTSLPPVAAKVCGRLLAWVLVYAGLSILAWGLGRAIGKDKSGAVRPWNKALGAVFGAAKGCVILLIVLCALDIACDVAKRQGWAGTFADAYANSFAGSTMKRYSPIRRWRVPDRISTLIDAARNPSVLAGIENEQEIRKLLNHPKITALLKDPEIEAACKKGDLNAILSNKNVEAILSDRDLLKQVLNLKMLDVLEERVKKAKK